MSLGHGYGVYVTFNDISVIWWWSVLLVEETGVPKDNLRPVGIHWQTFITKCCIEYTSPWVWNSNSQLLMMIGTDCIGSCKSNYNIITTMTALYIYIYDYATMESYLNDKGWPKIYSYVSLVVNLTLNNIRLYRDVQFPCLRKPE